MELLICSIFDNKACVYNPPVYVRALGQAERWFVGRIMNPDDELSKFPGDFTLVHLGRFDDQIGKHIPHDPTTDGPRIIGEGLHYAAAIRAQS